MRFRRKEPFKVCAARVWRVSEIGKNISVPSYRYLWHVDARYNLTLVTFSFANRVECGQLNYSLEMKWKRFKG